MSSQPDLSSTHTNAGTDYPMFTFNLMTFKDKMTEDLTMLGIAVNRNKFLEQAAIDTFWKDCQSFSPTCASRLRLPLDTGLFIVPLGPLDINNSASAGITSYINQLPKKPDLHDLKSLWEPVTSEGDGTSADNLAVVDVDLCWQNDDPGATHDANFMVCRDEVSLKRVMGLEKLISVRVTHRVTHDTKRHEITFEPVPDSDMPDESVMKDAPIWAWADAPTKSQEAAETADTAQTTDTI